MTDWPFLANGLSDWVFAYMAVLARLSFIIFFLPGIGEQVIPIRVRLMALLTLSAAIASNRIAAIEWDMPLGDFLALLATELTIGFLVGSLLRILIWMLTIVGSVIAQSIGLSQFLGVALDNEAQTLTSNLLSLTGAAILLTANFHIGAIAGFVGLYQEVPPGMIAAIDRSFIIQAFTSALGYALLLAWPFVVASLLYNLSLGFINKAMPQLMVAFVGAPFMVGAGTIFLVVSISAIIVAWSDRIPLIVGWM